MKINDKISKEILKKLAKNFGLEKILELTMNRTTLNSEKKLNSVLKALFDLGDVYTLTKTLIDQSYLFSLNEESTTEENSGKIIYNNNKIKEVNYENFLNNKRKRLKDSNDNDNNNDDVNNNINVKNSIIKKNKTILKNPIHIFDESEKDNKEEENDVKTES